MALSIVSALEEMDNAKAAAAASRLKLLLPKRNEGANAIEESDAVGDGRGRKTRSSVFASPSLAQNYHIARK